MQLKRTHLTALITALAFAAFVAPASGKTLTKTFSSGPTTIAIPDAIDTATNFQAGTATSDVPVSKKGVIKDLNAAVQITHPDTNELQLYLFKGTNYIPLSLNESGPGTNTANYGGGTGCAGGITAFDMDANLPIAFAQNPFAGSFLPEDSEYTLDRYTGTQLRGTWRLLAIDDTAGNTGTINCFQVTAKYVKG